MTNRVLPITLISLLSSLTALAQTQKGSTYLRIGAGDVSYSQRAADKSRSISGTLLPAAGRFVGTNVLVGAEVPLGYSHYKYEYTFPGTMGPYEKVSFSNVTFGINPFVRYYLPGTGSHRFFGQVLGSLGWQRQRQQSEYPGRYKIKREKTIDYQGYGAGLGYNYLITPSASFELAASYNRSTLGPDRTNGNLALQAGFVLFLPGAN